MELDYNQRYASAIEMQQAIHKALSDIKAREAVQDKNTLEMSAQPNWQQETRLPGDQTLQIPLEKLPNYQQGISEETIQSGALGYQQNFGGQNTGGAPPPTPNTPFNTGGSPPYNTGGNQPYNTGGQYPAGGNVQPTEMAHNFAGVPTGGNVPPQNYQNIPINTGGAMHSNNPISPNAGYMPNYGVQPPPKKSSKVWLVIPVLLLMFLGVAGAGGGLYFWYQSNGGGITDNSPTPTASTSPSATASASKTPTATPSVSPTQNAANAVNTETPKPTAQPTASRPAVVLKTPAPRTPAPAQRTPRPNQQKNSDCIFTGDC
jgi:hypothetical protein